MKGVGEGSFSVEDKEFDKGEVEWYNVELHEEAEGGKVERDLRKVDPLGFPRGHGTPVCYSNCNTRFRVLTM